MAPISARKAFKILNNLEKILAIELLCAAQAFDFRRPLKSSIILEECHKYIRNQIPHINEDTILSEYINSALDIIKSNELLKISQKI